MTAGILATIFRGALLFVAAAALAASGCYEDTAVTLHTPGVYKGKPDSRDATPDGGRTDALRERFRLVQTDR